LTTDLPVLWQAPATTSEERQTIVRLLLERVLVTVVDGSEQVRLECHWHGGNQTADKLVRPVARAKTLSMLRGDQGENRIASSKNAPKPSSIASLECSRSIIALFRQHHARILADNHPSGACCTIAFGNVVMTCFGAFRC